MDVRKFGAERIGLCRTEHMFFNPMRIKHRCEMILAETEEARRVPLRRLYATPKFGTYGESDAFPRMKQGNKTPRKETCGVVFFTSMTTLIF